MPTDQAAPEAIPPETGREMHVERSGEVRGSGMGAGGGQPGEDFSADAGGAEAPPTARPGTLEERAPTEPTAKEPPVADSPDQGLRRGETAQWPDPPADPAAQRTPVVDPLDPER